MSDSNQPDKKLTVAQLQNKLTIELANLGRTVYVFEVTKRTHVSAAMTLLSELEAATAEQKAQVEKISDTIAKKDNLDA